MFIDLKRKPRYDRLMPKKKTNSRTGGKKANKKNIKNKPAKKAAAKPAVKTDSLAKKIKIKVIGIGNGGGAIVASIAPLIKGARFFVVNTDKQALAKLRKVKTFQFGETLTEGFGTGMDMVLAEKIIEAEEEKAKKILEDCDLCILVACLGGGTGSGMAPVFAQLSRKMGHLTYGIFTLPFCFEGEKKLKIAKNALKKLAPVCHAVSIVPNEKIFQVIDEKSPLRQALAAINKLLAFYLEGLIEMIHRPGFINIDFADFKTILTGRGSLAYLAVAEAQGEARAKQAALELISSPLYDYGLSRAKRVLFDISAPGNLSLAETAEISSLITQSIKASPKIIFGVSPGKASKLRISLLAVGCEMRGFFAEEKARQQNKKRSSARPAVEKKELIPVPVEIPAEPPVTMVEARPEPEKKETAGPGSVKRRRKKKKIIRSKPRKNALEVKKANEELEKELEKQEEVWETPAFMRRENDE